MATLLVEDFVVTFVDLVGIVGGTLGMFIGFAFYDNIIIFIEYIIAFVLWVKRMNLNRRSRKVSQAQVQDDPSTKKIEAKSKQMNTKVVVGTKKKNTKTTLSKKGTKLEPSPMTPKEKNINTTLPKEQTKDVKENETKKIQVTTGKVKESNKTVVVILSYSQFALL